MTKDDLLDLYALFAMLKMNWDKGEDRIRRAAQESALNFISDIDSIELGLMTLRRAYEIGYRAGMHAEQRKNND